MIHDTSSFSKILPPPLRRPYPITDPRLNKEIRDCILYYNNLAILNRRVIIEWINSAEGYVLGKIWESPNGKNKVKRCNLQDIREILNIGGRWLRHLRSCENRTFGLVPWEIVHYTHGLGPFDLPGISYHDERKNLNEDEGWNAD